MSIFNLRVGVVTLLITACSSLQAAETFEAQGLIREVDPIVRSLNVAGSTYRVDEEVFIVQGGQKAAAIPELQPGDIVAFNGIVLSNGDRLIQSINLIRRDFKPELPGNMQEQ
ncbi:PilY2 family type 4a fimbrial biogenesis protein [Allohahella sp. A8]|uniref:PilY2 family type 4a fimbrial biogenesis protein n=1 Tax=Allohahella sp. A8 TaxID=3141461 RepID=UPI003A806BBB